MKSNSLHEYAQLAGYLQTRVVPGIAKAGDNGPDEEQLNPDLTLFMKNMKSVDIARSNQSNPASNATPNYDNVETERYVIELESEGTDFHTVFKNQQVGLSKSKDLLVTSIVSNLAIRGFVLREQVISYYSQKYKSYVAAAKRPIPSDAVIPAEDIEKNGRLNLKIWPPEKLPESLLLDLDCRPKPRIDKALLLQLKEGDRGNAFIEATLRSSCSID